MSRNYRKSSHTKFSIKAHLIWVTKYRYGVLVDGIQTRIRDLIRQTCESKGIEIIRGHVGKDHVHLFVSYPPCLSVAEMMKSIKGRSSRRIQEEFPQLGKRYWGKHFRAIGYAAFSAGDVTEQMVKQYIKDHEGKDYGEFTVDSV